MGAELSTDLERNLYCIDDLSNVDIVFVGFLIILVASALSSGGTRNY